jgi:hypothetical protein
VGIQYEHSRKLYFSPPTTYPRRVVGVVDAMRSKAASAELDRHRGARDSSHDDLAVIGDAVPADTYTDGIRR